MRRAVFPTLFAAIFLGAGLTMGGWTASTAQAIAPAPPPPTADQPADPAQGHPSSDTLKKEFSEVIDAQLAAFRAGEYDKAYSYAAAQIKDIFPLANFKEMVESAYPVIAHSTTAEFGLAIDTGDEAVINVRIENAEKKSVLYQYMLEKQAGKWKISGVAEVKASGLSV